LRERLSRYLSPPLFPVRIADLPCNLTLHDVVATPRFKIGDYEVQAGLVCHPGPTVGFRIHGDGASLTYLPDHEPALGLGEIPSDPEWIPGFDLARNVDLLIHDAQFTSEEYPKYVGWGHSSIEHALAFARAAGVRRLAPFHHDPSHSDAILDRLYEEIEKTHELPFELTPATEGTTLTVSRSD
jgi:phosphoribosyl 1,2-cyclic phosphodiesterase